MSAVLEVVGLTRAYPGFRLKPVTFTLEDSRIMGLLGPDGAGKTTLLKSIVRLIRPDDGGCRFFGLSLDENERLIRQRISYSPGGFPYYQKKKISEIAAVSRRFYSNWDGEEFEKYLARFALDPTRTPAQLTDGMRVKLHLALAMGHRARLLLLDEPTRGLDPVARDEVTDAFWHLRTQGVSILFSSRTPADLERCADDITYLREGSLVTSESLADFLVFHRHLGFGEKLEDVIAIYEKEGLREKPETPKEPEKTEQSEQPAE